MAAAFGILLVVDGLLGARLGIPLDVLLLGLGVVTLAQPGSPFHPRASPERRHSR